MFRGKRTERVADQNWKQGKTLIGQPYSTSPLFIRALLTIILENGQLVVEFFSKISLSSRPMDGQQIITGF